MREMMEQEHMSWVQTLEALAVKKAWSKFGIHIDTSIYASYHNPFAVSDLVFEGVEKYFEHIKVMEAYGDEPEFEECMACFPTNYQIADFVMLIEDDSFRCDFPIDPEDQELYHYVSFDDTWLDNDAFIIPLQVVDENRNGIVMGCSHGFLTHEIVEKIFVYQANVRKKNELYQTKE